MLSVRALVLPAILVAVCTPSVAQTPGERLRTELEAGRAGLAVAVLRPLAASSSEARMALGFAQFTHSVEKLVQGLYRYGLKSPSNPFLPIVRVPVPPWSPASSKKCPSRPMLNA